MYRDDPLDDELELRAIVGDEAIDMLIDSARGDARAALDVSLDVMRVLQGWAGDDAISGWFHAAQRRLAGLSPIEALAAGRYDDVEDAAKAWAAAQG